MANDNPVYSFFVVTVDTWAGVVLCGAGGYYAFEVNTFSHSIFIFAEVPGSPDPGKWVGISQPHIAWRTGL